MTDDSHSTKPDGNRGGGEPDNGSTVPSIRLIALVALATIVYNMGQEARHAYDALVVWSTVPDGKTVYAVLNALPVALILGAIRGALLAPAAVLLVWLGPTVAGVVAGTVSIAAATTVRFASRFVPRTTAPPPAAK